MDSSTPFPHCLVKLLGPIEMGEVVETDVVDLPIVVDPSSEILDRLGSLPPTVEVEALPPARQAAVLLDLSLSTVAAAAFLFLSPFSYFA